MPDRGRVSTAIEIRCKLRKWVGMDSRNKAAIARSIGMSHVQLYQVLSGDRQNPSVNTVARILMGLGKTWADLD